MELLTRICCNLVTLGEEAKRQLEVVEGDGNIADLQGFIAGVGDVEDALTANGYSFPTVSEAEASEGLDLKNIGEQQALIFADDIGEITIENRWRDFLSTKKDKIEAKKNFLYMEAKKGRDLAFVGGWKKAVEYIEKAFQVIDETAETARMKGEMLDF